MSDTKTNRSKMAWVGLVVAGLAGSASAAAWNPDSAKTFELPEVPARAEVADLNGGLAIVATAPSGTWVLHPQTGRILASAPRGGNDLALADINGDKWIDILLCADDGIWQIPLVSTGLGAPVRLASQRCGEFELVEKTEGLGLVSASDQAYVWSFSPEGKLSKPEVIGERLAGAPLVAGRGARFAVMGRDDQRVLENSEFGRSSFATGGRVGGLAAGERGWSWTLPEAGVVTDVTRRRVQVAPNPGSLASGDLDGDGVLELLVEHSSIGFLGIIAADKDEERLVRVPGAPRNIQVVDIDGDRCGELVYVQPGLSSVTVVPGVCPAPEATAPVGPATPTGPVVTEPASQLPEVVTAELDVNSDWQRISVYVGQKLELILRDPQKAANSFAGRGGPRGLVVRPDGKVTYTARADHIGRWRVSVRMWGGPSFVRRGGFELAVRPTPAGGVSGAEPESSKPPVTAPDPTTFKERPRPPASRSQGFFSVRSCMVGVGVTAGATDTSRSWSYIGTNVKVSASPALSFSCEGGNDRKLWWFAGVDSAPFFFYLVDDATMRHGAAATMGVGYGDEKLRVGGFGTAGLVMAGLGARMVYMPFQTRSGLRHGLDVRATWFPADAMAAQGMILWSFRLGGRD